MSRCSPVLPEQASFRLGVNYWPANAAMAWLAADDPARTRADFARIAGAGFDTARVFVRWEDAQPAERRIDARVLGRLVDAADAAADAGLGLIVTLFVGHMSGANWIPPWALGGRDGDRRFRVVSGGRVLAPQTAIRNWYSDPDVVAAQERLAAAVAGALAGHPAVWAWDLGNENSNCTVPPDASSAQAWLERITGVLRRRDPGRPVTIGIHMEDLEEDRVIGPAEAAAHCDFVSMHGYPIYADWSAGPADDRVVPFLEAMTRWLAGGVPVFFEEFGLPTTPAPGRSPPMAVDERTAATYVGSVLDGLWAHGALGAAVWCFSDYAAALFADAPFDRSVHERSFGLWRADGSSKPAVAAVRERSGRQRQPPSGLGWIDVEPEEFAAGRRTQLARLYGRYCRHVGDSAASGAPPRRLTDPG